MMGSRSIYHEGWKATTNHISTGVLDEEELATGSRDFADDRWELFDLTVDFSEATDRADDEPERVRQLRDLWDAEAVRNNVLPISDGLVDRFAGFIPPPWPAGSSRVFLPGGGPVADESVPLLWGGFRMTADIDTGTGSPDGVVCALGDWFGGYALYVAEGRAHFTFARSYDVIELADGDTLEPGTHELAVLYAPGRERRARRAWRSWSTATRSMRSTSRAISPWPCSTAAPACASARTSGSPSRRRYTPPAPFGGTVHQVRIDAPGTVQADPADEVRAACTRTEVRLGRAGSGSVG